MLANYQPIRPVQLQLNNSEAVIAKISINAVCEVCWECNSTVGLREEIVDSARLQFVTVCANLSDMWPSLWGASLCVKFSDIQPNSPDFSPLSRKALKVPRFSDDNEVQGAVENYFHNQHQSFFTQGIYHVVDRWDTCFNLQGGVGTCGFERCHLHEDQARNALDRPVVKKTAPSCLDEGHLGSWCPFNVPPLKPTHRRLRLKWCRVRRNWTAVEWNQVVFSGESRFNLNSDDNRVRAWRPRGERLNPAFVLQRHTAPTAGVMESGAIAFNSRSSLVLICVTMTAQRVAQDYLRTVATLPWPRFVCDQAYLGSFGTASWASHKFERTRGKSDLKWLRHPNEVEFILLHQTRKEEPNLWNVKLTLLTESTILVVVKNALSLNTPIVRKLKGNRRKLLFVEWAQNEIAVVPDFHKRILFSDEAHFWLNRYVNKQNCRIWSEANPQVYVETPLHPEKLTVWCALWAGGILLQKR
ncbi:transposable element Tcb1 transposase [Trichonephila clavipes]|nr:transposable element Tcb1 transposase [Trichonephila clavipes]